MSGHREILLRCAFLQHNVLELDTSTDPLQESSPVPSRREIVQCFHTLDYRQAQHSCDRFRLCQSTSVKFNQEEKIKTRVIASYYCCCYKTDRQTCTYRKTTRATPNRCHLITYPMCPLPPPSKLLAGADTKRVASTLNSALRRALVLQIELR